MIEIKQILKTISTPALALCFGLILSFSFLQIDAPDVEAASQKAKNACQDAIKNTSNAKAKKSLQDNIDACYYGYDNVGDAQNFVKKCRNKYKSEDRQGACMAGAGLAQNASPGGPPPVGRCNADDIKDPKECKKAYKRCDKKKGKKKQNQCKENVINEHKKTGQPPDTVGMGEAGEYICGTYEDDNKNVHTKFDFGCLGTEFADSGKGQANISPILDLTYAAIRFLSIGVGIIIAISVIMSGIQYSMSEGNAEVTQKAKSRIRSAIMGLVIYIFTFSMVQFLVPGGIFKPGIWLDENILQLISRLSL